MRARGVGRQLDGAPQLALGAVPVPFLQEAKEARGDVGLREPVVEGQGRPARLRREGPGLAGRESPGEAGHEERVREARVRQRVAGVVGRGLVKAEHGLLDPGPGEAAPEEAAAAVGLVGLEALRLAAAEPLALLGAQLRHQGRRHALGHRVLDGEEVRELLVEVVGPQGRSPGGRDQLDGEAQA